MENKHGYATVVDHLEEFRHRLICCITAICFLIVVTWPLSQLLIDWIVKTLCPPDLGPLYYTAPMELFFLKLKFSAIMAICIASPYIMYQLWSYVSPGLFRREKRMIREVCGFSFLLFLSGVAIGLFIIFPILMRYSLSMQTTEIKPLINVSSCLGMAAWLMLGFGICFQLPIVLIGMIRLELIGVERLRRLRPYIVIGIFLVAAILTPPDIISQLTMGIPTWILYEISLIIGTKFTTRTRKKNHNENLTEVEEHVPLSRQ